jgi:hypothetical protein
MGIPDPKYRLTNAKKVESFNRILCILKLRRATTMPHQGIPRPTTSTFSDALVGWTNIPSLPSPKLHSTFAGRLNPLTPFVLTKDSYALSFLPVDTEAQSLTSSRSSWDVSRTRALNAGLSSQPGLEASYFLSTLDCTFRVKALSSPILISKRLISP